MTVKQKVGKLVFRKLPFSRHVFDHIRLESNAIWVRTLHWVSPFYKKKVKRLFDRKKLLINVGCGPYGKETGWINLDLFPIKNVYMRTDCRKKLLLASGSCTGIHVEMFLEHLDPVDELPFFLKECYRTLENNGILRVVVPDARKFLQAYLTSDWTNMNQISYGNEDWSRKYSCKMEALNHVFLQGYEHYGGWDFERVQKVLNDAGFTEVNQVEYNKGDFPEIIDREYHKTNGLYVEAIKSNSF